MNAERMKEIATLYSRELYEEKLGRQPWLHKIDVLEAAIRAAIVEVLSEEPSEAMLQAGKVAWMKMPMIWKAMASQKRKEVE